MNTPASIPSNNAPTEPTEPAEPAEPAPIYNPFAVRAKPVNVGHLGDNSLKPTSLKRRAPEVQSEAKKVDVERNPLAASLLSSLVPPPPPPPEEEFEEDEDEEAEETTTADDMGYGHSISASVPGPQLRFTLVPYGMEDSEESDEDDNDVNSPTDSNVPPPPPPPESENGNDDAFAQFMADIASL